MKLHLAALISGMVHALWDHTELPATHTFYTRKGRATPGNIHPQSSTAVTHCLLIATHFTHPRKYGSLGQARELKPGVERGPLASEASVLPHNHLLPWCHIRTNFSRCNGSSIDDKFQ